ncbi:MAG: type II toxin-antitoxin system VapC family toxin [Thermofilum sp.]
MTRTLSRTCTRRKCAICSYLFLKSKFRIHVSVLSVQEFLSYIYYKLHDYSLLERAAEVLYKLYVVENIDRETALRAAMIAADLVKRNQDFNLVDVFNAAIAVLRNIPILTDDPSRYSGYARYGVTAISVEDFIEEFKATIKA